LEGPRTEKLRWNVAGSHWTSEDAFLKRLRRTPRPGRYQPRKKAGVESPERSDPWGEKREGLAGCKKKMHDEKVMEKPF